MTSEVCYWLFCFIPQSEASADVEIFGFAEFIGALALLVLLYMVADIRYRFRLSVTPGYLYASTFILIVLIGLQTLLTDLWVAEEWWVPRTVGMTAALWQTMFGLLFLIAFLTWMYYAFIRPPIFGRRNAKRYAQSLYRVIVKGSDEELAVIANELVRSVGPLVMLCRHPLSPWSAEEVESSETQGVKPVKVAAGDYAHDLLLLMANRKLCRHVVQSSPVTALKLFGTMTEHKRYGLPVGQFAKTVSAEAISNKDSILYHEGDRFTSGLLGYIRPWSQAIYGDFELVESLANGFGSPLDIDYREISRWDADNWEAYCGAFLTALGAYLTSSWRDRHSYAIARAFHTLESARMGIYSLSEQAGGLLNNDIFRRFRIVVNFVGDAVQLIEDTKVKPVTALRSRSKQARKDIYDELAECIVELVFTASTVEGGVDFTWTIQHNTAWSPFFGLARRGKTWRIIQFKVRRLLYEELKEMDSICPNYKGARILGLLLNVMGLKYPRREDYGREYRALHRVVLRWTRRRYLRMREDYPDVAESVLAGSISFDKENSRLVKTWAKGLSREAPRDYLELDPLPRSH